MSTLTPPIPLQDPKNQVSVDYIQDEASQIDFDYPVEFFDHTEILWRDKGVPVSYTHLTLPTKRIV